MISKIVFNLKFIIIFILFCLIYLYIFYLNNLYSTTIQFKDESNKINKEKIIQNTIQINKLNSDIEKCTDEVLQYRSIINDLENTINIFNNSNNSIISKDNDVIIPILIFTCNRAFYLEPCLKNILSIHRDKHKHPIIVSQDCNDILTTNLLNDYKDDIVIFRHQNITLVPSYEAIARHYKWALSQVFKLSFDAVIVLEDDLEVSPDFLEYFKHFYPILKRDDSLFCISAWNDNAKSRYLNPDRGEARLSFQRTDYFPGLGWMLTKEFWNEIEIKWPTSYWDDFIRGKSITKDRQCIQPQLPRVKNIGLLGTSATDIFEKHLKEIEFNNISIDYSMIKLDSLNIDNFNEYLKKEIEISKLIHLYEIDSFGYKNMKLKYEYQDKVDLRMFLFTNGLMDDNIEGTFRSSYKNIVSLYFKTNLLYLIPKSGIKW